MNKSIKTQPVSDLHGPDVEAECAGLEGDAEAAWALAETREDRVAAAGDRS